MGEIVIIGLGPGGLGYITLETWKIIQEAPNLALRTAVHPAARELKEQGVAFTSYDWVYDKESSFDKVYETICSDCIRRALSGEKIVYAVPGSPLVAEKTVALIRERAREEAIPLKIIPAMSFLDLLYNRLGIDPIDGITVTDASDIETLPPDLTTGIVVTQVYNRTTASQAKLALMEFFPDEHRVVLLTNLGLPDETILDMPLYELDRQEVINHLTSVYVPPCKARPGRFTLEPLIDIMAKLRSPGGCVWDIEQTHSSLRRYIVEEVYEVLEAIELEDGDKLAEELGDLLLQIVFHARIAEECGVFTMQDVVDKVTEKMIRRHPHVFGDITVRDAAEVVVNWEKIKSREKKAERLSVLDGVPKGLPSLMRAGKLQAKAAKMGFDWDSIAPVWNKVEEELGELKDAAARGIQEKVEEELGDLLFAVVNLARFLNLDPEVALNSTNNKFVRRFSHIEARVKEQGVNWDELDLKQLDLLWEEAKTIELLKEQ